MSGPYTLFDRPKDLARFKEFLTARGCDVLAPTNPYELLRFKAAGRTNVAYTSARGKLSIVGPDMGPAAASFANGQAWTPAGENREQRMGTSKKRAIVKRLLERDGPCCFYCPHPLSEEDRTVEHLVPIAHGGTNRIGNMALSHAACNLEAGHLSVFEKIRLRESKRAKDNAWPTATPSPGRPAGSARPQDDGGAPSSPKAARPRPWPCSTPRGMKR